MKNPATQHSSEVTRFLNVNDLLTQLSVYSHQINVSIVISSQQNGETSKIDSYTQFSLFNFNNGPAITVFKSSIIPNVDVQTLRDCLNLFDDQQKQKIVRLLRSEDGFSLHLKKNGEKYNFFLSGFQKVDRHVAQGVFEKYGLSHVVHGGTFVSLVFREDG